MYGISGLCSSRVVRLCSIRFSSHKSTKKLLEFLADMPKVNSPRIAEAQRQRQNITKKTDKYSPSTVYLQVIGSGARGTPNTLYLFTDHKRYLFNCGECTQRLAHEHKIKLSKLEHIFVTSKTWKNIGGLPGLSLTLQDVGLPNITLHGPEGLDELYSATSRFVIMKDMNVTMEKCYLSSQDFEDGSLTVKYILLGPHESLISNCEKPAAKRPKLEYVDKEFEEFIHDDTDYYKHSSREIESLAKKDKHKAKPKDMKEIEKEKMNKKRDLALKNLEKRSACTVAFICTVKKRMGTLDLAKCVEMGVKPGPMLGQLKNGHDVILPDGKLVLSKDVKTPDDPGPVFIVMEVPDLSYLKESEFSSHFDDPSNPAEKIPSLIVHLTPPHVFNHPRYQAFTAMFGSSTRHLVLNSQNSCLGSEAVHRTQHKLNLLDSEIFPLLKDASVPAVWDSSPTHNSDSPTRRGLEDLKNKFQNIINMEGSDGDGHPSNEESDKLGVITPRTLTMYHLRPKKEVDRSAEPKLHIQDYIRETMDVDGFVGSLEQFKRMVESMRDARAGPQQEYPKVVFLGTGSCIPSKTRNTSAIVVQISENHSMLMDCGEGTFGQLVRFYGPKKVNSFFRTLKAIYVSHLHADHHIGLIGVLQARREAFQELEQPYDPVYLFAPGQIITWLAIYDHEFERIKTDFTLIPNQNLLSGVEVQTPPSPQEAANHEISPAVLAAIGIQDIRTCLVNHCPNAFGVSVQIDGTHKVTYSGDTIPCEALVQLGKDSTLLIHEATMEDELADEARVKMHSTASQAIEVGRQMNAKYTVLTHFSQRYARIPRLNAQVLNDNKTVGIAFDNMQISMNDLELLPHMYAPLQLMFVEHCVEMEMKANHRARQKQRRPSLPGSPNSDCKSRVVSPGCRQTSRYINCAPLANYRETNSSRLRQEVKGMTITGYIGRIYRTRSNSSSSSKKMSTNSSPPRAPNDSTTLKRNDSENTIDLMKPRSTTSNTTNASKSAQEKLKPGVGHAGYVCDSRSKTLNTTAKLSSDKLLNFIKAEVQKDKRENPPTMQVPLNGGVLHSSSKGYGKPLVTPINTKLLIRRNNSNHDITPVTKAPNQGKIPAVPKPPSLVSKPPSSVVSKPTVPVVSKPPTSSVTTKLPVNHKTPFNTSPRIAESYVKAQLPTKEATATLAHSTNGNASLKRKLQDVTGRSIVNSQRPVSATTNKVYCSKERNESTVQKQRDVNNIKNGNNGKPMQPKQKTENNLFVQLGKTSKAAPINPSLARVPTRIRSENSIKQRKFSTEKLKEQFCRDTPLYASGRPNSAIHSSAKQFKPQLEDIKSSYLLLNKRGLDHEKCLKATAKALTGRVQESVPERGSKYIDDKQRRENLEKIKQKFKSRSFLHDSRYDKIEGLNWISWKA